MMALRDYGQTLRGVPFGTVFFLAIRRAAERLAANVKFLGAIGGV